MKAALASALDDDEGMAEAGGVPAQFLEAQQQQQPAEEDNAGTAIVMAAAAGGDAQLEEVAAVQEGRELESAEPGGRGAAGGLAGTPYETVLLALLEGLRCDGTHVSIPQG